MSNTSRFPSGAVKPLVLCLSKPEVHDIINKSSRACGTLPTRKIKYLPRRGKVAERYRKPEFVIINKSSRACGAAVAQRTHNPLVVGSNPSGPILKNFLRGVFFIRDSNHEFSKKILRFLPLAKQYLIVLLGRVSGPILKNFLRGVFFIRDSNHEFSKKILRFLPLKFNKIVRFKM